MIFATDLDRTLIYSHLFLDTANCTYSLIEKKGEKAIAYMSDKAIALLEEVHQRAHIIPITLRNEAEFHRIDLFRDKVVPELFVTNNGGTIYYKGKEDMQWHEWIEKQMKALIYTHQEICKHFLEMYGGSVEKNVNCGNLVWLFMGERDHIHEKSITAFEEKYKASGWRIDVSGRKIYVYPYFVTKWYALSYIQQKYYNEPIYAAGDSIFDQEMVEKADYGMIPKASFIEQAVKPHVKISEHAGMRAAEDILLDVLNYTKE